MTQYDVHFNCHLPEGVTTFPLSAVLTVEAGSELQAAVATQRAVVQPIEVQSVTEHGVTPPAEPEAPVFFGQPFPEFFIRPVTDPAIKADWVKALRSGEYSQGFMHLSVNKDGKRAYCCLGVLCETLTGTGRLDLSVTNINEYCWKYDESTTRLPDSVQQLIGLGGYPLVAIPDADWEWVRASSSHPEKLDLQRAGDTQSTGPKGFITLAELNDKHVPFGVIATVIEKFL